MEFIITLLTIIALFVLNLIAISVLNTNLKEIIKQINNIEKEKAEEKKENTNKESVKLRTRGKITPTNFSNVLNGRAYDKYKNSDGLYEPRKTRSGIPLDKREE